MQSFEALAPQNMLSGQLLQDVRAPPEALGHVVLRLSGLRYDP